MKVDCLPFAKERSQAIQHGEWKHFTCTITVLKERKCACFTSEEKTCETIRKGEFLRDGSATFKFALSILLPR